MPHDLDYQTRVIMNMDYSKTIAKARVDEASAKNGISPTSTNSNAWMDAATNAAPGSIGRTSGNSAVGTQFDATPVGAAAAAQPRLVASGSGIAGASATAAPAETPSLWKRILMLIGLGD